LQRLPLRRGSARKCRPPLIYQTEGARNVPTIAAVPAAAFDPTEVWRLMRWVQANPADDSYAAFGAKAKAAGCAGYIVSFLGRRVVYFGHTAETHVEHFPK
jgi:hypothetical protein